MCKKYFLIILCSIYNLVYAIIPTIDQYQMGEDLTSMANYTPALGVYIAKLEQSMTAVEQIKQLRGLQQISTAGTAICDLCSPTDIAKLHTYINQVNGDLCSQFAFAMQNITGLVQSVNDINDVISLLQTNPKAAMLSLQQAAIRTQTASQNSLAQLQLLIAQQSQKTLAEQKLEQQSTELIYAGFKQSGL